LKANENIIFSSVKLSIWRNVKTL